MERVTRALVSLVLALVGMAWRLTGSNKTFVRVNSKVFLAVIEGWSMYPTLKPNQVVLVVQDAPYAVDDIVAVKHPHADYYVVKRIAFFPEIGGEKQVFIIGDNDEPGESIDSRHYGPVAEANIIGRVVA